MALRIGIVGAGLGGLAAAIAFRRQGHSVDVFEASAFSTEIGAAVGVPPNAVRVLKSFGYHPEGLRSVDIHAITTFARDGGRGIPQQCRNTLQEYGHQWVSSYRVDFHNELKRLAFGGVGDGPPAMLHLGIKVSSCDPTIGEIVFINGERYTADLIVGADGIRSTVRTDVVEREVRAPPSGYSAFRWVIDTAKLDDRPDLDWVYRDGPPGPRTIIHGDRQLFLYPCRDKTLINAVLVHRDVRNQDAVDWNAPTTRAELLSFAADFHPKFQAFLELAPDSLRIWQLRTLPPLPTYVRGCAALVGDACHAMFPTLGQGSAMAVEDACVLGLLFPLGTKPSQISERLIMYDSLRRPRDEFVRQESFEQATSTKKRGTYLSSLDLQDEIMGFNALGSVQLDASNTSSAHF